MSPRRSKLELRLKILTVIRQGRDKPTRIMYAANMSWRPVQSILSHLMEQDFILESINTENRQSKKLYHITEKGENVLDYFEKARDILPLEDIYA